MKKILIGFLAGLICGLFTVGGGLILVPAFIYFLKLEPKKARATSVFCILPMVLVTFILYKKNNIFNLQIGIKCAIGGIIGGILGANLLNKIPDKYVKIVFDLFLIYAGIKMIL